MNSARLLITSAVASSAASSSWRRSSVAILSLKPGVSNMAGPGQRHPARASSGLRGLGVLLVEPIDATRGVEQLLLAREERVAVRADVDAEVAARREGLVDHPTRAGDPGGAIVRMS